MSSPPPVLSMRRLVRTGWLEKEGQKRKSWKKRFFRLFNDGIYYFLDDTSSDRGMMTDALGFIRFDETTAVGMSTERPDIPFGLKVVSGVRTPLYLRASSEFEALNWLDAIRNVLRSRFKPNSVSPPSFAPEEPQRTVEVEEWLAYVDGAQKFPDEFLLVRCPASVAENSEYSFTMVVHGALFVTSHRLIFHAIVLNRTITHVAVGNEITAVEPMGNDGINVWKTNGSVLSFRNVESQGVLVSKIRALPERFEHSSASNGGAPVLSPAVRHVPFRSPVQIPVNPGASTVGEDEEEEEEEELVKEEDEEEDDASISSSKRQVSRPLFGPTSSIASPDAQDSCETEKSEYALLVTRYCKLRVMQSKSATSLSVPDSRSPKRTNSVALFSLASISMSSTADEFIFSCPVTLQYSDRLVSTVPVSGRLFFGTKFLVFRCDEVTVHNLRRHVNVDPKYCSFFCRPIWSCSFSATGNANRLKLILPSESTAVLQTILSDVGSTYELTAKNVDDMDRINFVYSRRGRSRVISSIRKFQNVFRIRRVSVKRAPSPPSIEPKTPSSSGSSRAPTPVAGTSASLVSSPATVPPHQRSSSSQNSVSNTASPSPSVGTSPFRRSAQSNASVGNRPSHILTFKEFPIILKAHNMHDATLAIVKDMKVSKVFIFIDVDGETIRSFESTEVIDVSNELPVSDDDVRQDEKPPAHSSFCIAFRSGACIAGYSKNSKDIIVSVAELMWV
ncbi:mitochondrial N-terminal Pleckstrin homology (PH) domain-containing protein [Andalucia godoyi]|uniref:Mitochondrial N-terminal Pleckstrin homology (PH) domain-containing protein n=1 Tax=Andalucia godoyi TaxID=505711 RepID=A0A8K0F483_ANDGO|nr:mitochondrial N-terminal Pleckstrin homology (PH) domain-containing protein [Andalucia godoyi]|eukprot:ANDGO_05096.mRNA.1 mitochondrial N-terminal Pleckstrin homology (PH) domain-containing protein